MAKSVAEAKQLCTTDLDDFDDEEDDFVSWELNKALNLSLFTY
jgi:predicted nucleotidyltransferase